MPIDVKPSDVVLAKHRQLMYWIFLIANFTVLAANAFIFGLSLVREDWRGVAIQTFPILISSVTCYWFFQRETKFRAEMTEMRANLDVCSKQSEMADQMLKNIKSGMVGISMMDDLPGTH